MIIFMYGIIIFLSLIGLTQIIKYSINNFFTFNDTCKEISLLFLNGDNAEFCLRNYRRQYIPFNSRKQILAIDCGLSDEMKQVCEKYCKRHNEITMIDKELLSRMLNTL